MDKLKELIRKYSRLLFQATIVCACILVITFFMPRKRQEQLPFTANTPWEHSQLIAEFDFGVPKSPAAIEAEKESIAKATHPHFAYNPEVGKKMNAEFEAFLEQYRILDISGEFESYKRRLRNLYNRGIVSDDDAKTIKENSYREAVATAANSSESKDARFFTSRSDASKMLKESSTILSGIIAEKINLDSFIKPNYTLDKERTAVEIKRNQAKITPTLINIQKGQRIINKGDIVDETSFQILDTYLKKVHEKEASDSKFNTANIFIGQMLCIIIIMCLLYSYLYIYFREVIFNNYKFIFTILSITILPVTLGLMFASGDTRVFILPFAMIPMLLCLFINNNIAFVAHVTSVIICSLMLETPYEFVLLQLAAGYSVILSLKDLASRSQMFRCVVIVFLTYTLVYIGYTLISSVPLANINYSMFIYFAISSLLTLIAYPLMAVIENTFHFVSNVTLIELSNFNNELLLKLSQEAPGTFQHSIQVGNLAAEAARAIGANSLEVRTGALYHDIGKCKNPIYFTENQNGGINLLDQLEPLESAQKIKKHVTDGLEIAKHKKLPKTIMGFIATHHGDSFAGYFYKKYKEAHPNENIDAKLFRYPGPKPSTAEQAILTMADCVEAASHSLKEHSEKEISEMVDTLIDNKLANREFSLTPLTFQDIDTIKKVFKKRLMAIYHTRVSYPKEQKPLEQQNSTIQATQE